MTLRIAVIGNCQAPVVGRCLTALCPEVTITSFKWNPVPSLQECARLAAEFAAYDTVVTQINSITALGELQSSLLARQAKRIVYYPSIHFPGFHPDAIVVSKSHYIRSRISSWHSTLMLAAHRLKVPRTRVPDLFNAYIFAALGYFDEYEKAYAFHAEASSKIDWSVDEWLPANEVFVYVPNHPTINVMWRIARGVAARLGLDVLADAAMPEDELVKYARWPVFPEVASRLGVPEQSFPFFQPHTNFIEPEMFTLEQMVDIYFWQYKKTSPKGFNNPRIRETAAILMREGV